MAKSVIVDGGRVFSSVAAFARWLDAKDGVAPDRGSIYRCFTGRAATAYGHRVEYLEDWQARRIRALEARVSELEGRG